MHCAAEVRIGQFPGNAACLLLLLHLHRRQVSLERLDMCCRAVFPLNEVPLVCLPVVKRWAQVVAAGGEKRGMPGAVRASLNVQHACV